MIPAWIPADKRLSESTLPYILSMTSSEVLHKQAPLTINNDHYNEKNMGSLFADRELLFEKLYATYNKPEFIHPDPLEFLHGYPLIADREIVGIIASSLAYGRVTQILRSVSSILKAMGSSPRDFIESASITTLSSSFSGFKHRFTTGEELIRFLLGIRKVVRDHGSLCQCFLKYHAHDEQDITGALQSFVEEIRSHMDAGYNSLLPCPEKKSACKRLHLFLRWMVRNDAVDMGGWTGISASKLLVPLDTHMHRIGLRLGMTSRRQADMKTALEITHAFKKIVPDDPVKYDFALTRLGIRADADLSVLGEQGA
jgi:uncharacterized protein (TIGR02757 family)